ncbi:AraC family transcriptional regulator [Paenibacillus nasutitermitis]|uniref:AraC family transcriptional regulator n=1 Tax=Paenibacillus nasutitermitis TaxID=1652958 RepID=A0A917DML7_9BACL|nr:AraC family transcriptional regulator [Paenibacillus nasutitermitis]GGD50987.1 AraC family transcriptional regulator [Paenibacillus nasutitermitis]
MFKYPEYQDVVGNYTPGQLPCYISINTIASTSELHHHDFAELSLVIEGTGTETINGIEHEMKTGTASFLLPHHIHEIHAAPKAGIRAYCCMFDMRLLMESSTHTELGTLLLRSGQSFPSHTQLTENTFNRLAAVFDEMIDELHQSRPCKQSMLSTKLIEALLIYIRAHQENRNPPSDNKSPEIANMLQYIHLNYGEALSLEHLSAKFHISIPHICRLFKKEVGISFLEYLHQLRIQSASHLLVTTNMPIGDVLIEAGFESYRSFVRLFKRFKGVIPSEYRSRSKKTPAKPSSFEK